MGSLLVLLLAFGFVFFVVRGCVATQESTQVRKYVTGADSVLSDSSNAGRNRLQGVLENSGGNPKMLDEEALARVADLSERLYTQALQNDGVPPEFEDAQPYLVSALGLRKEATENLASAAAGGGNGFGDALATAVEDFRTSDSIIDDHYVPAVRESLEQAGQTEDGGYLEEPRPFMDYGQIGFGVASSAPTARGDPGAVHGVRIDAGRRSGNATVPGIEPKDTATVEAGPVGYEKTTANETLRGSATFGS